MDKQENDNEINLDALKQRDKYAFAELLDQNSSQIYRLALKMVGNVQDAEDILQETFIQAYNNIDKFEGRAKVSTWLYRIAVNQSLMTIRKRKRDEVLLDPEVETQNGEALPRQIVDWCCLPEKELMSNETRLHIEDAIKTLSDTNRAAFLLRDVGGLSTRDAAEALDISESALKVRLMRARMQLREELTDYFIHKMAE